MEQVFRSSSHYRFGGTRGSTGVLPVAPAKFSGSSHWSRQHLTCPPLPPPARLPLAGRTFQGFSASAQAGPCSTSPDRFLLGASVGVPSLRRAFPCHPSWTHCPSGVSTWRSANYVINKAGSTSPTHPPKPTSVDGNSIFPVTQAQFYGYSGFFCHLTFSPLGHS